ncbi:glycosyltransferase [Xanthobacter sp.]|uniref:glycosyltransferase n=1 Tax=Xanthobacter sp. TaxID=35809 RepID=UPI0035B477D9
MSFLREGVAPFDCSIVLTVHGERHLLTRSLASLDAAALYAGDLGYRCELVVVHDATDPLTSTIARTYPFKGFVAIEHVVTEHRSLGPARNSGVRAAHGAFIATADGDDLVSINMLSEMLAQASVAGERTLMFPELLIGFGAQDFIGQYYSLDDEIKLTFLAAHPYVSRVFGPRSYFLAHPYADARVSSGYAYEDWHFNAEAVARGMDLHVVRNTALFYRKRRGSLLNEANAKSVRQTPPTLLFRPDVFLDVMAGAYDTYCAADRRPALRPAIHLPLSDNPVFCEFILAANAIEPAVNPSVIDQSAYFTALEWSNAEVGAAYFEICRLIGAATFTDIFLFPFLRHGGAEKYIGDVMRALLEGDPARKILVLLGEADPNLNMECLPPECEVVDFKAIWPDLEDRFVDLITLRLIEAYGDATIHLRQSVYAERFFSAYAPVLGGRRTIFYRFCDECSCVKGEQVTAPWGFSFVDAHVEHLFRIVSDNGSVVEADVRRLGAYADRYAVIYAPQPVRSEPRAGVGRRVLWASRLVAQKRPELIAAIADSLAARASDIVIDVRGDGPDFDAAMFAGRPNIAYGGPFGRFADVVNSEHFAFLYTSVFDGLPNVLLEAAAWGLPSVAPHVGGIAEFVVDGETGILLPSGPDDAVLAAEYADALIALAEEPERRRRLALAAQERLRQKHAAEVHRGAVLRLFGVEEPGQIEAAAQ